MCVWVRMCVSVCVCESEREREGEVERERGRGRGRDNGGSQKSRSSQITLSVVLGGISSFSVPKFLAFLSKKWCYKMSFSFEEKAKCFHDST